MRTNLFLSGLGVTALLVMTGGCAHSETPPGPGPTAVPQVYQSRPIGPGEPVNTESRPGGATNMHDRPQ